MSPLAPGGGVDPDASCVARPCGPPGRRSTPAPYPLSMLTTVTPGAQELSIASRAASPPNEAPYPTLVGTATSGTPTRPPTTEGSAPSMPATTIRQSACVELVAHGEQPVQPGDADVVDLVRRRRRARATVSAASAATGASEVPALTIATVPRGRGQRAEGGRAGDQVDRRRRRSATASRASSDSRVASTARSGCFVVQRAPGSRRPARASCPRRTRPRGHRCGRAVEVHPGEAQVRRCGGRRSRAEPIATAATSRWSSRGWQLRRGRLTAGCRSVDGEVRQRPQGTPSWVEHSSADPQAAKEFYGQLFGWDAEDAR